MDNNPDPESGNSQLPEVVINRKNLEKIIDFQLTEELDQNRIIRPISLLSDRYLNDL